MAQFTPTLKLPFTHFTGLPAEAQMQIRRDFEEVGRSIIPTASVYDCLIDAALPASLPSSHLYKNLTDAIAGETQYVAGVDLTIGVYQRGTVRIVEPGAVVITGKGDLTISSVSNLLPDSITLGWDFRGISGSLGQQVFLNGLALDAQIAGQGLVGGATLIARDCWIGSNFTASLVDRSSQFWSCIFNDAVFFTSGGGVGVTITMFNCDLNGSLTTNSSLVGISFHGGRIQGNVTLSAGGTLWGNITSNVTCGNGNLYLSCEAAAVSGSVTFSGTGDCMIEGSFFAVTLTSTGKKYFTGSCNATGSNLDVTGPALVIMQAAASNFGAHTILRGDGVQYIGNHWVCRIEAIGLTNSQITSTWWSGNGNGITLDAASHNNLLIISGVFGGGFGTYTDSGANNRLITEKTDSIISSPPAAGISSNLIPSELAAIQTGITTFPAASGGATAAQLDAIRKDMVPAWLNA